MSLIAVYHDVRKAVAVSDDRQCKVDPTTGEKHPLPGRVCKFVVLPLALIFGSVGRATITQRLSSGITRMCNDHELRIEQLTEILPALLRTTWTKRLPADLGVQRDLQDVLLLGADRGGKIRCNVFRSDNDFVPVETTANPSNRLIVLGGYDLVDETLLERYTLDIGTQGEHKRAPWVAAKLSTLVNEVSTLHPESIGRASYFAALDRHGVVALPPEFPSPPAHAAVTAPTKPALAEAGRFYVGSITTPAAGQPDTTGNADGGAAAQMGITTVLNFSTATIHSVSGTGAINNPQQAIDSDPTTYAAIDFTADGTNGNYAELDLAALPGVAQQYSQANLIVDVEVPTNSVLPVDSLYTMAWFELRSRNPYVYSPTTNLGNFYFVHPGFTQARQLVTLALPLGLNLSQLFLEFYTLVTSTQVSGSCEVRIHDARIVAVQ